ncbi:MAG: response regulator transcription factor, partial [Anaeroplasmataceae bacterium]
KDISLIINKTLSKQGYEVRSFYNAKSFFEELENSLPDLILLDIMLPDLSGKEILTNLRADSKFDDIDVIIISANHMLMDKIDGLDLGADDYIEKPFDLLELMSRVNARLRRKKQTKKYTNSKIEINMDEFEFKYKGQVISLTNKEFEIMVLLLKNKGKVVSRDELLNSIWGTDGIESRTVDMHIKSIRKKTDEDIINTIYGVGYKVLV